jgi:hypothetical protein
MRLLLEAATHMILQSRLARRIVRRPYYSEARRFFELIAPTYDVEVAAFDRFLAQVSDHPPRHRRAQSAELADAPVPVAHHVAPPDNTSSATVAPSRRRRRHRGGRRRSGRGSAAIVLTEAMSSPNGESDADAKVNVETLVEEPKTSGFFLKPHQD